MTDVEPVIAPETTGEDVPADAAPQEAPEQTVAAADTAPVKAENESEQIPETNGKRKAEEDSDEKVDVKKMNTGEVRTTFTSVLASARFDSPRSAGRPFPARPRQLSSRARAMYVALGTFVERIRTWGTCPSGRSEQMSWS